MTDKEENRISRNGALALTEVRLSAAKITGILLSLEDEESAREINTVLSDLYDAATNRWNEVVEERYASEASQIQDALLASDRRDDAAGINAANRRMR